MQAGLRSYWGGTSASTADAHTLTMDKVLPGYYAGQFVGFLPDAGNTGPATAQVNDMGQKSIYANGAPLTGGELVAGQITFMMYDGTHWQILGGGGTIGTAVGGGGGNNDPGPIYYMAKYQNNGSNFSAVYDVPTNGQEGWTHQSVVHGTCFSYTSWLDFNNTGNNNIPGFVVPAGVTLVRLSAEFFFASSLGNPPTYADAALLSIGAISGACTIRGLRYPTPNLSSTYLPVASTTLYAEGPYRVLAGNNNGVSWTMRSDVWPVNTGDVLSLDVYQKTLNNVRPWCTTMWVDGWA